MYDGVVVSPSRTPLRRFRRTVTVDATDPDRGDACDGDSMGAGSLDLADCTRCSSFCILPMSPRIWFSDSVLGGTGVAGALLIGCDDDDDDDETAVVLLLRPSDVSDAVCLCARGP